MRSHVTFTTRRFNQTEVKPHFINRCCFREDCLAWLIGELRTRGWSDLTEAWQEDWGWQTSGTRDGRRYLLSVGLVPEDQPEWLVHITERAPLLDRLRTWSAQGGSGERRRVFRARRASDSAPGSGACSSVFSNQ
jgi:hypothetical protein